MLGLTTKKPDEEGLSPTKKVSEEEGPAYVLARRIRPVMWFIRFDEEPYRVYKIEFKSAKFCTGRVVTGPTDTIRIQTATI